MKAIDKLAELRRRHVTMSKLDLLRREHVELAQDEAKVRAAGIRLHVIQKPSESYFCPYYHQSTAIVVCMSNASNHTHPVCFGCDRVARLESKHLSETDTRTYAEEFDVKYFVNGPREQFAYMRALFPNGDIHWYRRYEHGVIERERVAERHHLRNGMQAPPLSSLSEEELQSKLKRADKARADMARGGSAPRSRKSSEPETETEEVVQFTPEPEPPKRKETTPEQVGPGAVLSKAFKKRSKQ